MQSYPSSPPLLRSIFVSPSSTALVHDVTAEWGATQVRESLQSRRAFECGETKVPAVCAPEPREGV